MFCFCRSRCDYSGDSLIQAHQLDPTTTARNKLGNLWVFFGLSLFGFFKMGRGLVALMNNAVALHFVNLTQQGGRSS